MKYLVAFLFALALQHLAQAQYMGGYMPNPTPLNYLPNYYNRTTQPLSPYLNLARGGNAATNYYYGVRPGTPAGGVNVFGQAPLYQPFVGANAGGFLPQSAQPNDGTANAFDTGGKAIVLRSPSHAAVFGNTFAGHGSFASVYANRGANQPYTGLQKGVGSVPPPRSK